MYDLFLFIPWRKLQISSLPNCWYHGPRAQLSPECQQNCRQIAGSLSFEHELWLNSDDDDHLEAHKRHCKKKKQKKNHKNWYSEDVKLIAQLT